MFCIVKAFNYNSSYDKKFHKYHHQQHKVLLKIKDRYKESDYQYKYIAELKGIYQDTLNLIDVDCVFIQKKQFSTNHYYPGDLIYCSIYWDVIPTQKHPALFDSFNYWKLKGISAKIWMQEGDVIFLERIDNYFYKIRKIQSRCLELINNKNLSLTTKQIISALVLGNKRGLSKDISQQFSNLGLGHTLALSGLHISLIYGIFAFLLSHILKYKPRLQSLILVLIIFFYAILTGLSPSVLRASLMFLFYSISLALNRSTSSFNIVCISALTLLIYNSNLLYDIGFQLSYIAVFGILYFYQFFKKYLISKYVLVKMILGLAFISISAQLSTGILSAYYFHAFPPSFLWANIFVLPIIVFLLYLSVVYLFFVLIGIQFHFMNFLVDCSFDFLLRFLSLIEQYSFSQIDLYITIHELFYYYGLLLLICLVIFEKKYRFIRVIYCYLLIGLCIFYYFRYPSRRELFVNASKKSLLISIIANNEQVLFTEDDISDSYLLGNYSLMHAITCSDTIFFRQEYQNEFCNIKEGFVNLFGENIVVINNEKLNKNTCMDVSVLIQRCFRRDVSNLDDSFSPSVVLLDASMSRKTREYFKDQWHARNIEVVDLSQTAYVRFY